ncbi:MULTISPECIES: hypothetical protein [unclassified Acinetobacter]|uniref:hypothetical protein n=1 Tax=unclassified Acinetobacter TaxID=196816 RepID=UPI0015D0EA4C|nr:MULTISPECIES: hypothetical protein [unclassified Acinetobacter]
MNDFFLANNRSITIKVLGNDVEVKQLQMHNFDFWSPYASVIRDSLKQSDYSDLIGAGLVKDYGAHVFQLCSMCTNTEMESLLDLAESDPLEFSHLLKHVIEVNGAYFNEDVKPGLKIRKNKGSVEQTWFDSFQYLIAYGHRHDDILQMTYGAFIGFLKAAEKYQRNRGKFDSNIIRAAQYADKKGFTAFQVELSKH